MNNPKNGLPEHLFKYISSVSPMINVDLIIYQPNRGVILSWREDQFYGPGWHIPGGIIRFKENFLDRLDYVAKNEIKINKKLDYKLILMNQIMNPNRDIRGHFISFLFLSEISEDFIPNQNINLKNIKNGDLLWHKSSPDNLIPQHKRYSNYINKIISKNLSNQVYIGNILDPYNEEYEI